MKITIKLNTNNQISHSKFWEFFNNDLNKRNMVINDISINCIRFKEQSKGTSTLSMSYGVIKYTEDQFKFKIVIRVTKVLVNIYSIGIILSSIALAVRFNLYWKYFISAGLTLGALVYLVSYVFIRLKYLNYFKRVIKSLY